MSGRADKGHASVWLGAGLLVAIVASIMPLSHDEAFWLAITRKVETGARLYDGAIDNKPPTVYLVTHLLDWLPGRFQPARGLLVGTLIGWIGSLSEQLALLLGAGRRRALLIGLLAGAVVALQTEFVFTVELPALAAALGALWLVAHHRTRWAAAVTVLAVSFDPRVLLLLPGLVAFGAGRGARRVAARYAVWSGILTLAGLGVVLLHPDLRYGLIELNLGSRTSAGGWRPLTQLAVASRSLLPVAAAAVVLRPAVRLLRSRAFVWLAAGSIAIGVMSVLPFDHYWAYSVPALVVLPSDREEPSARTGPVAAAVVMTVAFLPLIVNAVNTGTEQRAVTGRYMQAAEILESRLEESDRFVSFDIKPYMAAYLPGPYALRSPVSGYLVWPTSRTHRYLEELPALIDGSVAISEDGGLSVAQVAVSEEYRAVWQVFHERLGEFPCVVDTDGVLVRFRSEWCPRP